MPHANAECSRYFPGRPAPVRIDNPAERFQSTRWAPRLKACRAFVTAANAAGGKAEVLVPPGIGIHGNSRMLMQNDNNLQIAAVLATWIEQHVGHP